MNHINHMLKTAMQTPKQRKTNKIKTIMFCSLPLLIVPAVSVTMSLRKKRQKETTITV